MNRMMDKNVKIIEHHCLQMRYAHLRSENSKTIEKLATSIEQFGQLVPVVIVPEGEHQWVLIDGYHRVKALKRLGKDTVEAEVWSCTLTEALTILLTSPPYRRPGILEEAFLLHELHTQHSLSQQALAMRAARDQSWISRRLSLVAHLPDSILESLSKGSLSLWIGARILAPMARAIPDHAQRLLTYLLKHPHSTREMHSFYEHYQKSNHQVRTKMVDHPDLFFKARSVLEIEKQTISLKEGPEGQWRVQCQALLTLLSDLTLLAPTIFLSKKEGESDHLLKEFSQVTRKFDELTKTIKRLVDC